MHVDRQKDFLEDDLKCGRTNLEMSSELKYLGVILTPNLKWERHLAFLEKKNEKLIRGIKAVNALTDKLTLKSKMVIYNKRPT